MNVIKVADYDAMSNKACELILNTFNQKKYPVLGLATGSTPEGLYKCLIESHERGGVSFKDVSTFNLDEYIGLDKSHPKSYHYFMYERLFKHIDIPSDQRHLPNGAAPDLAKECRDYEQLIKDSNHIDIQILGLGTNAHIGFNEPGTSFTSRTAVIDLADSTRQSNARFFNSIDEVPTKAISMGIGTIMESKEIILVVSGEEKADILAKVLSSELSESFPASVLQRHPNVTIVADEAALSKV